MSLLIPTIISTLPGAQQPGSQLVAMGIDFADLESTFPAASYSSRLAGVTINGLSSLFYSNGIVWKPLNGEAQLAVCELPVGIACTFTGSTNGAIVFGTPLSNLIPKCFVYYSANSLVASHAAGFYPTAFSSTTAAIVYNDPWVPAVGVEPTWPASPTAFSGAVPGGTGVITEVTSYKANLPGDLLGDWGGVESAIQVGMHNAAGGSKSVRIKLGASTLGLQTVTTSPMVNGIHRFRNIGSDAVQRGSELISGTGTLSSFAAIDTSVDNELSVSLQTSVATEWAFLYHFAAKVVK